MSSTPWAHHLPPLEDELLSSYLVRLAYAYGQTPSRFALFHLAEFEIWTRDIDRCRCKSLLQTLGELTGVDATKLGAMTLPLVQTDFYDRTGRRPGIEIGNTVIGIYHRTRRRHGLMMCTACASESGYFRRRWRSTWSVTCTRHRRALIDACPGCDCPIAPHRSVRDLLQCYACGALLTSASEDTAVSPTPLETALCAADDFDWEVRGEFGGVPKLDFLRGLNLVHRAIRRKKQHLNRLPLELPPAGAFLGCPEHLRISDRAALLRFYDHLFQDWPRRLNNTLHLLGVTSADLPKKEQTPGWLQAGIASVPGKKPRRATAARVPDAEQLAHLNRVRPVGWRTSRAALLMRMARRCA